eukprot:2803366-Pyramimonas_sp.AAC.2
MMRRGNTPSPVVRLARAGGIRPLPSCDWLALWGACCRRLAKGEAAYLAVSSRLARASLAASSPLADCTAASRASMDRSRSAARPPAAVSLSRICGSARARARAATL